MGAFLKYNMYLCNRKSANCAGSQAINALKKSDLCFFEQTKVRFSLSVFASVKRSEMALEKNKKKHNNIIFKFKLKCQD